MVHALLKDELVYEVNIRTDKAEDKVVALKKQLIDLLPITPAETIIETDFDPEEEILAITPKVQALEAEAERYSKSKERHALYRLKSMHWHLDNRLRRVVTTESDKSTVKKLLEARIAAVSQKLLIWVQPSGSAAEQSRQMECSGDKNVMKWNVKFNGKTDPRTFIERVEEMQQATGFTDERLFSSSPLLFTELGKIWYNGVKSQIYSWEQLKTILLEEFSPQDYDYQLMNEIRGRLQGTEEPAHLYFAFMSNLFDRLKRPLPESEKLEILRHNIQRDSIIQLALVEVETVAQLKDKCRKLESAKQLKPHLTHFDVGSGNKGVSSVQHEVQNQKVTDNNTRQLGSCYKCGMSNHNYKNCRVNPHINQGETSRYQGQHTFNRTQRRPPQQLHCFGCGEVGFTKTNCVKCNKSSISKN